MDRLKEILSRVPVVLVLAAYLGYLGYDYYTFTNGDDSQLAQKRTQIENMRKDNAKLAEKFKSAQEFFKTLDVKKTELRLLSQHLDDMKATLSDDIDIPSFVKMIVYEASKVGLKVQAIKPIGTKAHEYYTEQVFDLNFRGVYVQLLVFLERISKIDRILRVDTFDIKRVGANDQSYVEIEGKVQIKTFRYLGSKADEVVKAAPGAGVKPAAVTVPPGATNISTPPGKAGGK